MKIADFQTQNTDTSEKGNLDKQYQKDKKELEQKLQESENENVQKIVNNDYLKKKLLHKQKSQMFQQRFHDQHNKDNEIIKNMNMYQKDQNLRKQLTVQQKLLIKEKIFEKKNKFITQKSVIKMKNDLLEKDFIEKNKKKEYLLKLNNKKYEKQHKFVMDFTNKAQDQFIKDMKIYYQTFGESLFDPKDRDTTKTNLGITHNFLIQQNDQRQNKIQQKVIYNPNLLQSKSCISSPIKKNGPKKNVSIYDNFMNDSIDNNIDNDQNEQFLIKVQAEENSLKQQQIKQQQSRHMEADLICDQILKKQQSDKMKNYFSQQGSMQSISGYYNDQSQEIKEEQYIWDPSEMNSQQKCDWLVEKSLYQLENLHNYNIDQTQIEELNQKLKIQDKQLNQQQLDEKQLYFFDLIKKDEYMEATMLLGQVDDKDYYLKARDINGQTPLHVACKRGNQYSVIRLIQYGADTSIKDDMGRNCLQLTQKFKQEKIQKILFYYEAKGIVSDNLIT